ncbi:HAD family hydrolase [Neobacillus terrae]|uniref:HAD family hydrolase n=1 Tax=Neobacillus terrae TaxID=3034837 RepID=UPI00140A2DA8|nr:HAD family hydrolase [Neobacillus terrae]NHM29482.1 HAD family hydrolase [Neobacillus terrae]
MINTILFDVDGVLLSEDHYFDASALTVWEMLLSSNYLGLNPDQFKTKLTTEEVSEIRENVFQRDLVLKFLKSRGLNANWDMIYLTFAHQLINLLSQIKDESEEVSNWLSSEINRETLCEIGKKLNDYKLKIDFSLFNKDFKRSEGGKENLFKFLDQLALEKLGVKTDVFHSKGELWSVCEHVSQEWYVGDANVFSSTGRPSVQKGKKGFLEDEKTLALAEKIKDLFSWLLGKGLSIGIGTGRPNLETIKPFEHLGWSQYFNPNHIITADEVLWAQRNLKAETALSKPHPYTYLQSYYGKEKSAMECLNIQLPITEGKEILVVGDSLADLLAARRMGAVFAAVLTGLSGKDARQDFEKHQADYILDTVLDLKKVL